MSAPATLQIVMRPPVGSNDPTQIALVDVNDSLDLTGYVYLFTRNLATGPAEEWIRSEFYDEYKAKIGDRV